MKAIIGGRIIMPDGVAADGAALLFNGKIVGVVGAGDLPENCEALDAEGLYVSPGLVDIHIHGYLGADASDGDADGIRKIARGIARNGVTSWLPTTMTIALDTLRDVFGMMRGLRDESRREGFPGAEILGIHAEGPFINPVRKGAQNGGHIVQPDAAFIKAFSDIVRIVTVAPEMPGALSFVREIARDTRVLVSMGHSDASYEQAMAAMRQGLGHVTHAFNGMIPMSHRAPAAPGAALTGPVTFELIADTFHVHPGLFSLCAKMKGERLVLITDCIRAGGMPDGLYELGGQQITVRGIESRLADGTIAGSVLRLNDGLRNMRAHTGLPVHEVVNMASRNPAMAIGESRKGSLTAGKDADIILFDDNFSVYRTISRGETIYNRGQEGENTCS